MKKMKVMILGILGVALFFVGVQSVIATCTSAETNTLNSLASNVQVDYDILVEERKPGEGEGYPDGLTDEEKENYTFKEQYIVVYISNITEDLYVTVLDDVSNTTTTYTYDDAEDGVISFQVNDIFSVTNYTITVYSSDNTSCADTRLRILYLTTPRYNSYSQYDICDEAADFYLCYEYLTTEEISYDRFLELVNRYINEHTTDSSDGEEEGEGGIQGFLEFLKENIVLTVVVIVVILAAVGVTVVIIIRRRRRIV